MFPTITAKTVFLDPSEIQNLAMWLLSYNGITKVKNFKSKTEYHWNGIHKFSNVSMKVVRKNNGSTRFEYYVANSDNTAVIMSIAIDHPICHSALSALNF